MSGVRRPITVAIAALGGQGGGVLAGWLVDVARRESHLAQATSVPGVAQRTGATIYYLEFFPEAALPADGRRPVMALMPSPGDVDVVVAAELVEAGRAIQRGLVTPDRTVLIASTHRSYTISEKAHPGDGRADAAALLAEARSRARRFVGYDMAELAEAHGAVISAVVLGAIAGASGLPYAADSYRAAIRAGGVAVETNLAAFEASLARARAGAAPQLPLSEPARPDVPADLGDRIRREFPAQAWTMLEHGVARLTDYQDRAYAGEYLDRLAPFAAALPAQSDAGPLLASVARGLASWMSFEDTMRVAQLKTRPNRAAAIRSAVRAQPGQVVEIREFLKPRVVEICGTLPAALGRRLMQSPGWRRRMEWFTGGRQVRTTTISGYLFLRAVAGLRRWRRGTLRYVTESARADAWLRQVVALAAIDRRLALEVAQCQSLVRGYGEVHEQGFANFEKVVAVAGRVAGRQDAPGLVARLRAAALADERGKLLDREIASLGA